MDIILARHGETDWNAGEVFRGRADMPLNEAGLRQAARLGEHLGGTEIGAVYASPLQRALATAGAVAGPHRLEVRVLPGLIDFDYGPWQGLSHEEVTRRYPGLYATWRSHPEQMRLPGGESLDDVRRRALAALDDVTAGGGEKAVVLVSHRVVLKVLICALLGLGNGRFWNVRLDTAATTVFSRRGGEDILIRHNDTSYLARPSGEPPADF